MLAHAYVFLTAWVEGRLVGQAVVLSDGVNYALIDDVVVHPEFRNRGIGSSLVRRLLAGLQPLGLEFVQLIAIPGTEPFYERAGFRVMEDVKVTDLPPDRCGGSQEGE